MRAIQIEAFGKPQDVLALVDLPEPPAPGAGEVLLGIEYAPLNVHDLHVVRGQFFFAPELPGVVGNEAVGTVLQVGDGVANVAVGDRVLAPLYSFTWRERMVVKADGLFALPAEADPVQLSMLGINPPTAALLMSEYVELAPGDWIVQNAANSGVGRSVIAIAKERGLRTINIVRRADLVDELRLAGGDVVVVDGADVVTDIQAAIGDGKVLLGIDGIGGAAAGLLTKVMSPNGVIAAYAQMSGQPATIDTLDLIVKRIKVTGFFLNYPEQEAKIPAALQESAALVADGRLVVPVAAVYPLSAIAEAVDHVERGGKVILKISEG